MRENFSENLKEARLNANMTQAEVAKAVGVAKNTYCNWERGTREPNIRLQSLSTGQKKLPPAPPFKLMPRE